MVGEREWEVMEGRDRAGVLWGLSIHRTAIDRAPVMYVPGTIIGSEDTRVTQTSSHPHRA